MKRHTGLRVRLGLLAAAVPALLALAGCGGAGAGALDVSIPAVEIAESAREAAYADSELTAMRTGVIRRMTEERHERVDDYPPAEGAVVTLFAPHPTGRRPLRKLAETVTGADGRFRVGPGPAAHWVLSARLPGGAVTWGGNVPFMIGAFPLPEGDGQMMVRDGHALDVLLTDGDGAPLPSARLRAFALGYEEIVTADADGIAHLVAPPGTVVLEAWDATRRGARAEVDVPRPAGTAPFVLAAPDRGPVTGWVVDAATGAPLEGAVVVHTGEPGLSTVTDASGHFSLKAPRSGRIAAFGRGRAFRSYDVPAAGDVELRLHPAAALSGRVVDGAGDGVAGARLAAVASTSSGARDRIEGPLTDADGHFRFDWLPLPPRGSHEDVLVVARTRGAGSSAVVRLSDVPSDGVVELVLGGLRRVTGRIERATSGPCADEMTQLRSVPQGVPELDARILGVHYDVSCRTGAGGEFAFSRAPVGEATLSFTIDGAHVSRALPAGGDVDVPITLPAGRPLTGRVVDVAGQPVTLGGEARVELLNHPDLSRFTRRAPIGPDGSFRFDDLPEGRYSVRAAVRSFDVRGTVADAGASDVELVAERPADLVVEAVFPAGAERVPVTVTLRDASDTAAPPRTIVIDPLAEHGRGTFEIVRRGTYHIVAAGGPWRCRMRDVEIADGRRPPLELVLGRTIERTLSLVAADGSPCQGRRIVVAPLGSRGLTPEIFHTDEGGTAVLSGLAEGDWVARIVEPGLPPIAHRFHVGAGGDEGEIVLRYPPHGRIEIVIDVVEDAPTHGRGIVALLDAEGRPLDGWGPRARALASRWRVPADGRLVIAGIPAGRVTVVYEAGDGGSGATRRDADVEGGGTTTLRLP